MGAMTDIDCMKRALELAAAGKGNVAPNPMVGAVLCHGGRIIGEGYHREYGGPHAEVNCINAVMPSDQQFIPLSTMYVTLEPCAHFGKTPPCTDLLIRKAIPRVVIASVDPHEKVKGQGIARLKSAGIQVVQGILEEEAAELNCRFFTYHQYKRPYITLKWAQTADGFMGSGTGERLLVSGPASNIKVHEWRAAEDAILVGAGTAISDNPLLTVRLVNGRSPIRIVLQNSRPLPHSMRMFHDGNPVFVINPDLEAVAGNVAYIKLQLDNGPEPLLNWLYDKHIQGLMIEGGKKTLSYFLDNDCWDELKVIQGERMLVGSGLKAPDIPGNAFLFHREQIQSDSITTYKKR